MQRTFLFFSFILLALVSLAPLSVKALSDPQSITLCFNSQNGNTLKSYKSTLGSTPVCPDPSTIWRITESYPTTQQGVCVGILNNVWIITKPEFDTNGKARCLNENGQSLGELRLFGDIQQYTPPGTPPPPAPGPGPSPSPNPNPPSNSPQTQGGCESGFHSVGALCIPNSPFNNSNSVASSGTITALATRIIGILLFLAGIVAVIMIIIGGYQYMTAGGNDTQAANGRKTLVNAIIGLVIIILAYVIVRAVVSFIT